MVTQQQLMKLRKDLEKRKQDIKNLEELKKLQAELKRVKDPQAVVRRARARGILRRVGKVTLKGSAKAGRKTLDILDRIANEESLFAPRRKATKTKRRKKR